MNQQQEVGGVGQPNEFSTFRPPPLPPNSVTTPTTVIPSSPSALPLYTNQYFASYPHVVPIEDDLKEVTKNDQNTIMIQYRRHLILSESFTTNNCKFTFLTFNSLVYDLYNANKL